MKKFIKWVKGLFEPKYTQLKREEVIPDNELSPLYLEALEASRDAMLRERIAIAAMQGLLTNMNVHLPYDTDEVTRLSIEYANALIEALKVEKSGTTN